MFMPKPTSRPVLASRRLPAAALPLADGEALGDEVDKIAGEVEDAVEDNEVEDAVEDDGLKVLGEEDVGGGEGNVSDTLVLATLQNCCERFSAVDNSDGHCADMQLTILDVKFLLMQKQLTSTTLLQFACALDSARQFETQAENPLKLGNAAELVALALVDEFLLVLAAVLVLLTEVAFPKVDGGASVGPFCANTNGATSIERKKTNAGN